MGDVLRRIQIDHEGVQVVLEEGLVQVVDALEGLLRVLGDFRHGLVQQGLRLRRFGTRDVVADGEDAVIDTLVIGMLALHTAIGPVLPAIVRFFDLAAFRLLQGFLEVVAQRRIEGRQDIATDQHHRRTATGEHHAVIVHHVDIQLAVDELPLAAESGE
ncbi:hypothetical protein D9M70_546640 [compost metagenome]